MYYWVYVVVLDGVDRHNKCKPISRTAKLSQANQLAGASGLEKYAIAKTDKINEFNNMKIIAFFEYFKIVAYYPFFAFNSNKFLLWILALKP